MNKQELIKKLKDWQSTAKEDKQGAVYMSMQIAIKLAEQLDEPSREECEIIETERNDYVSDFKCSKCKVCFDLFRWVYAPNTRVNYCPNCGAKIKEKRDE